MSESNKALLTRADEGRTDERIMSLSEGSYRRGYYQGYFQALGDITARKGSISKRIDEMETFLYENLEDWRYGDTKDFLFPPEIWDRYPESEGKKI